MYREDIGSTLVRAITAFDHGGRSRRVLLRDRYLGVNCMTLGRGAVLCWRLVQTVALIAYCGCGMLRGRPGRPVDLVTGNFGAVGGLIYFRAIRAVGRSDCSDVLCKGLMDFEHQGGWSL